MALTEDPSCSSAYTIGTDVKTICRGSCRTMFDDIIRKCYSTAMSGTVSMHHAVAILMYTHAVASYYRGSAYTYVYIVRTSQVDSWPAQPMAHCIII